MIESNTSNKKHDSLDSHEKSRRRFLQYATAGLATLYLPHGTVFARPAQKSKKFVWVVLRGALDSLHTVVPINDPNYSRLRPKLSTSFSSPLLPLDDNFSLILTTGRIRDQWHTMTRTGKVNTLKQQHLLLT